VSEFGQFVKEIRERQGMSLREFCRLANLDPANWSKVERGIFPPPKSRDCVSDIANVLLLEKDSEERARLFELAALGHIPAGLLAEPSVGEKINVFFRLDNVSMAERSTRISHVAAHLKRADTMSNEFIKAEWSPSSLAAARASQSKAKSKSQSKAAQAVKRILKPGSVRSGGGSREKKR
jgi:transcriptional regulator with XRE-family HTH domain